MESYLTGTQASLAVNQIFIAHAIHVILGLIIMMISYVFIHFYLERTHSIEVTKAERNAPSKNMFSLKAMLEGTRPD